MTLKISIEFDIYQVKLKLVEKAERKKNWSNYILLHQRPYRFYALCDIADRVTDRQFWELFGEVWSDSENLWQQGWRLPFLLKCNRPGREFMMNATERKLLKKLPDEIKLFRGHQSVNRDGFSWSVSYWKAKWFSVRLFPKRHGVISGTIKKENIIALLLGRSEYEIVAFPEHVEQKKPFRVTYPAWLKPIKETVTRQFSLDEGSCHGPWHWDKVLRNAMELCRRIPKANKKVLQTFAVVHDCKRKNEIDDPRHGQRAATFVRKIRNDLPFNKAELDTLCEACQYHNDGQTSDDPTIGACWDADRLDLNRVKIVPDPKYFSTEAGKDLIWRI